MFSEHWVDQVEQNLNYLEQKRKKSFRYYSCTYDYSLGTPIPENIKLDYYRNELYDFKNLMFGMFQINLENFFEIKFHMLKQLNCQYSEIEQMPYYELEYQVEKLKKYLEKEKEQREKEEAEYKEKYDKKSYSKDADSMMKKYGSNASHGNNYKTPSMPKMGANFKM
jgi:hypothetical protein